ncbi:MAG: YqiJ family protein [Xanthomonadales bacterium]|nr:YqiJ family protein [Xanthomonadales bacterium]
MWHFLGLSSNWPFSSALAIMLIFALIEGVSTLIGAGLSQFVDALLPDLDVDMDADFSDPSATVKFLSWLRFGEVPAIVCFIVFLTVFGLLGLAFQASMLSILGTLLPPWLAAALVLVVTLPVVSIMNRLIAKIIPKDETQVVSANSFVGRVAYITLGEATLGSPTQAKVKDRYGHTHYVMIEPDHSDTTLKPGDELLITEHHGSVYRAIVNPNHSLSENH